MARAGRRTKIVATLGPACDPPGVIERLIEAGVDVARLNFSHGTAPQHAARVARVRASAEACGVVVGLLADLQGPRIRVGDTEAGAPVDLPAGSAVALTTRPVLGRPGVLPTTYDGLPRDAGKGDRILLDDGLIELLVEAVDGPDVRCRVLVGGAVRPHKGMNLPGVRLSVPTFTEKDREDLRFALTLSPDYVALSFVRGPEDLATVRAELRGAGGAAPLLVAKIERPEAVDRLSEILAASDGVMVARGDLAVELSLEAVPLVQKRVIAMAAKRGVPSITATQMLESMVESPRPTRAEVSDVANAIVDGTDAVMLSAETAAGRHPVEAVRTMAKVAQATEEAIESVLEPDGPSQGYSQAVADAACAAARDARAEAIVAVTTTGRMASLLAQRRPTRPIIALTPARESAARLALLRGVTPLTVAFGLDTDQTLARVSDAILASGIVRPGATVVVVAGKTPHLGATHMVKVLEVAAPRGG